MGFYNAEGVAKYIPYMYIHLATRFLKQIKAHDKEDDIKYKEYYRSDWTYHCKGLWYYPADEEHPLLTLIGSSNYGQRSLIRDLECQVAMVTQNTSLRKSLHEECSGLFEHGKDVSLRQIENNPQRKLPLWVWLTTVLFDSYV
jgi:CDP-diacylglycerol--glycerol-3-phosphate 3-phosphatidyltransferase